MKINFVLTFKKRAFNKKLKFIILTQKYTLFSLKFDKISQFFQKRY